MELDGYYKFLERKKITHTLSGFECHDINPHLFEFQRWILNRALKAGKYAIFANTGLGKSLMQLEWANKVAEHTGKPVLILAPLAVVGQTVKEGAKFGIEVSADNVDRIYVTNYEDLDNVDISQFAGVVLDESSILKDFQSKTKEKIIDTFKDTPYKLACTATPSPNDVMELCNHAEFLDVMTRSEMLAMYFVHDGGDTSKWRLKRHAEKEFWDFVSTWATMCSKPSDLGFSDKGYDLPPMHLHEVFIETPIRTEDGYLFNDVLVSATDFHRELRETMDLRIKRAAEIVNASSETYLIWINQDEEGRMLRQLIPEAIEVKGSDTKEYKKDKLLGFANNEFRVLITKPRIARFGMNYQNCHNQLFVGMSYSFEDAYQCMRRSYRFGQTHEVDIYMIVTDTMQGVKASIERKQRQFLAMQQNMAKAMNASVFRRKEKNHQFRKEKLPIWI